MFAIPHVVRPVFFAAYVRFHLVGRSTKFLSKILFWGWQLHHNRATHLQPSCFIEGMSHSAATSGKIRLNNVSFFFTFVYTMNANATSKELRNLERTIISCSRCPRLVQWREEIAREKVARFRNEQYWGKPVPPFGDPGARLLIVGLAPAAHGANRTGRMFTGDRSGEWLYRHCINSALQTSRNRPPATTAWYWRIATSPRLHGARRHRTSFCRENYQTVVLFYWQNFGY